MGITGKLYTLGGLLLVSAIVVADIASNYSPLFGRLGYVLWILSYVFVAIFALRCLKHLLIWVLQKKAILTVLVLLITVLIIASQLGNPASLSGETTIETECTLRYFYTADDLGFRKTCLFGYPARQYFLSSLPTIIFGRSLTALNLGGSLYFLLGIVIFIHGVFRYFGVSKKTDLFATLAVSSLLHFYYFNHFLFLFEQGIFPLSFGLILTGAFMEYYKNFNKAVLIPIAITILFTTSAYTPSLALFFLSIPVLIYLSIKLKDSISRSALIFITISVVSVFVGTLQFRGDLNFFESSRNSAQMIDELKKSFEHLLTGNLATPFSSVIYRVILPIVLLVSLIGLAGYSGIIFSGWILGVLFFSILSKGYYSYALNFRLHRSIVALPIFVFLFLQLIHRIIQSKFLLERLPHHLIRFKILGAKLTVLFVFIILISGLAYNQNFLKERSPNPHYAYINWIKSNIDISNESTLYITHEAAQFNNLISLSDTQRYFIPNISSKYVQASEIVDTSCRPKANTKGMILLPEFHDCYQFYKSASSNSQNISYLGNFKSDSGINLVLFEVK